MTLLRKMPVLFALTIAFICALLLSACGSTVNTGSVAGNSSATISVVAAENFYGDVAKQIGGSYVTVTSILADPNVDPHVYESKYNDSKAIRNARLVIANGGGYDDWMDKLLSSTTDSSRVVLKGFAIAPTKLQDNVHVWYSVDNMQAIARSITASLKKLDAAHATTFDKNFATFTGALDGIRQKITEIKARYNGTPVGLTETIFLYQAGPLGLKVQTPFEFQKAMAEGNDPPANTVIEAENQLKGHKVKVLLYNQQTASPVTDKLQADARAAGIPIVALRETMPAAKNYQRWMLDQLNALEQGLRK